MGSSPKDSGKVYCQEKERSSMLRGQEKVQLSLKASVLYHLASAQASKLNVLYILEIIFLARDGLANSSLNTFIHLLIYAYVDSFVSTNTSYDRRGIDYLPEELERSGKGWSDIVPLFKNKFSESERQRVFYSLILTS